MYLLKNLEGLIILICSYFVANVQHKQLFNNKTNSDYSSGEPSEWSDWKETARKWVERQRSNYLMSPIILFLRLIFLSIQMIDEKITYLTRVHWLLLCGNWLGLHNNGSGHQKYQMKRSIRRVVTAGLVYREALHVWELHSAELVCLCVRRRTIALLVFVVLVHENKWWWNI